MRLQVIYPERQSSAQRSLRKSGGLLRDLSSSWKLETQSSRARCNLKRRFWENYDYSNYI